MGLFKWLGKAAAKIGNLPILGDLASILIDPSDIFLGIINAGNAGTKSDFETLISQYEAACKNTGSSAESCCAFFDNLPDTPAVKQFLSMPAFKNPYNCTSTPPPSSITPGNTTINIDITNIDIDKTTTIILPPKIIFNPPDIIPDIDLPPVELPPRRLPPKHPNPNSTKVSSRVCNGLQTRKFGNLLAEPIGGIVSMIQCDYTAIFDEFTAAQTAWQENLSKSLTNQLLDTPLYPVTEDPRSIGVSILGTSFPFYAGKVHLFYKALREGSKVNILPPNGIVPVSVVQYQMPCEILGEVNDSLLLGLNWQETSEVQESLCDLGIPIRNFKSNLPGAEGYKRQLTITFVKSLTELKDNRHLSLPNPRPDLTPQLIFDAIGSFVEFGDVKYECDVLPYGYLRYYGPNDKETEVQAWFDLLITELVQDGSMKPDSFRFSKRKRDFDAGVFIPYVAYDLEFSTPEPLWKRYDLRF